MEVICGLHVATLNESGVALVADVNKVLLKTGALSSVLDNMFCFGFSYSLIFFDLVLMGACELS